MRSLGIFICLVNWIDLILQIVIELNVLQHLARLTDHEWSFKNHKKLVYDWSKEPKMRFLVIFINLVWWIDLILQIVIEVNVLKHSARLTDHEGSFKYHKNAFLNDPNSQKWGFWPFSAVCLLERLDIAQFCTNRYFTTWGIMSRSSGFIQKSQICIFNDPKSWKRGFWPFSDQNTESIQVK